MKFSYDVTKASSNTVKWPQVVAGLSAAGGAFAVGAALGERDKEFVNDSQSMTKLDK